jgi:hypothetical protein
VEKAACHLEAGANLIAIQFGERFFAAVRAENYEKVESCFQI